MKKKIFALSLALILALALAACGGSGSAGDTQKTDAPAGTQAPPADTQTPPAEILNQCVDILKAQGIDLVVTEYSDYVFPNTAVEDGEEDANYFQHIPYLNNFNAERGTHLVSIAGIHIEPIGIYAGKTASLDAIPDGGRIAVPNDTTNEGRALLLLEAQGIIKLKDSTKLDSTPNDIAENPKNLEFVELAAENIPSNLDEVDVAAINSNYALGAGLNPVEDALVLENSEDNPYVNILAVKEGNENSEVIQALVKALQSDTVRDYILNTYGGAVLPAF